MSCDMFDIPALIGQQFLESTASQLTYHGICELNNEMVEGDISVFFRNNHFNTLMKKNVSLWKWKKKIFF